MDEIIGRFPPKLVAFFALLIGLVFIILNDPPKTACSAQVDLFRESQRRYIFASKIKGLTRTPDIEKDLESCRHGNGPGACFDLFDALKRMAEDIENIPRSCAGTAAAIPELKYAVFAPLKLMVQAAWGDAPPQSIAQKNGWLDASDIALYCRLKEHAIGLFGADAWAKFRIEVLKGLRGASLLGAEPVWQRSLLSTPCENYR